MPLTPQDKPPPVITLDQAGINALARAIRQRSSDPTSRTVLAIAGIPASGKSTLAQAVADQLNRAEPGSALVYPMDGFHLSNDRLGELGLSDRKGAPQTFDAQGYIKLLAQLRDAKRTASIPVYDRGIEEAVFTGKPEHTAGRTTKYIITEGNYLLLESMPWNAIGPLADLTVFLDTPVEQAHRWIIDRHVRHGRTPEAAEHWYQTNDRLNTEHILAHSLHAGRVARWP